MIVNLYYKGIPCNIWQQSVKLFSVDFQLSGKVNWVNVKENENVDLIVLCKKNLKWN